MHARLILLFNQTLYRLEVALISDEIDVADVDDEDRKGEDIAKIFEIRVLDILQVFHGDVLLIGATSAVDELL